MIRVGFDSNILICAAGGGHGPADIPKIDRCQALVFSVTKVARLVAPAQVLGEAVRVLSAKLRKADAQIAATLASREDLFDLPQTTLSMLKTGVALARAHQLQHWESVIVAVAADAGCQIFLSEDMQHGFSWRGLTVVNPFTADPHPLLASLLDA